MTYYARISGGIAAEILSLPDEIEVDEAFHPDVVSALVECSSDVAEGWMYDGHVFTPHPGPTLDQVRLDAISAVNAKAADILSAGAPVTGGLHVELDGESRADMGAMATTAAISLTGATEWPDSYRRGWITVENARISLDAPEDGIALAALVGDYYAQVRQRCRDLKDALLAADTIEQINAVDIESGWPPFAA